MQKITKNIIAIAMILSLVVPMLAIAPVVRAQGSADSMLWGGNEGGGKEKIRTGTGLGATDPRDIVANVIKILLGFLGLIAVIIILMGGFKWMMSQGSEDKIEEARGMIINGFIGLLIILAAFGLATFLIDKIYGVTGATG